MNRLFVLPSEHGFPLDRAVRVGSSEACDVVVVGAAPEHLRIDNGLIEALSPCVIGGIPLAASQRRLVVPGCKIALGEALLVVRDDEAATHAPAAPPTSTAPTRSDLAPIQ